MPIIFVPLSYALAKLVLSDMVDGNGKTSRQLVEDRETFKVIIGLL